MSDAHTQAGRILIVSWHSTDWIMPLIHNLLDKADAPEQLAFTLVDNTGGKDDTLKTAAAQLPRTQLIPCTPDTSQRSIAHAQGIAKGFESVTEPWCLLADPDIHLFREGWDTWCRTQLFENNATAAGAPYPPWKLGKYHHFPSPVFCAMHTARIRVLGADWHPFSRYRTGKLASSILRKIVRGAGLLNRRTLTRHPSLRTLAHALEQLTGTSAPDTGYQLAKAARQHNHLSPCLQTEWDATAPSLPQAPCWHTLATQYELYTENGTPFLTHKYNSSVWLWRTPKGDDASCFRETCQACEQTLR